MNRRMSTAAVLQMFLHQGGNSPFPGHTGTGKTSYLFQVHDNGMTEWKSHTKTISAISATEAKVHQFIREEAMLLSTIQVMHLL